MCWWTSEIARGERAVANRVIVSGLVGRTSPYQPIQLPTSSTYCDTISARNSAPTDRLNP